MGLNRIDCSLQLGGTAVTMIAKTIKTFLSYFYRRVEEDEENLTPPQTDDDLHPVGNFKKKERKDDKLAREKGIDKFISVHDIVNLPFEEFIARLELKRNEGMNEEQSMIAKDMRRRQKNKIAAQNCRKRANERLETFKERKAKMNRFTGIHSTPPGQYPEEGPKPGKMGVIFYYLSIVLSILGIIMLCRYPLLHEQGRLQVVALGFSLIFFGLFCLVITNIIVNKENRAFVKYLDLKVEQYLATHKKNIQAIPPDGPLLDV